MTRGRRTLVLTVSARMKPAPLKVRVTLLDGGKEVARATAGLGAELTADVRSNLVDFFKSRSCQCSTSVELEVPGPKLWSPTSPFLYDLKVELLGAGEDLVDTVTSYAGLRTITLGTDERGFTRLLLNGEPTLLAGALDQGYWPDGVYLAPTDDALRFDIEWCKGLGINSVRKHVKIEPQRWYYWADKLGLLVFQDLPTGLCGDPATDRPASPEAADQWRAEATHIFEEKYNHPCIVCWDLFNEAFGGFDYERNAAWAATLDPTRLINESSGFPWHGVGQVLDGHGGIDHKDGRRLMIISESGTPSCGCAGHQWPHAWSYGSYDPVTGKSMDFLAYYNKHKDMAVLPDLTPAAKVWLTREVGRYYAEFLREAPTSGKSGNFYCQLIDVETECDGLMSYDREVAKVEAAEIAQAIRAAMPVIGMRGR